MGGPLLNVVQCPDTRRVLRAALDAGWRWVGYTKSGHVEIEWPPTGELLHCATTPSDRNAWKQFARSVQKASGVELLAKVNRRRSRKNPLAPDKQVEAQRQKHRRQVAQRAAAAAAEAQRREEARRRQAAAAARAADDERNRREIESLMRPGYGR